MLLRDISPIIGPVAIAGMLAQKNSTFQSNGTLKPIHPPSD
jgi:hypothetical protein